MFVCLYVCFYDMYVYLCMGLSENSVPLHPMVLLIRQPLLNGYNWGYTPFSDIPIYGKS